MVTPLLNTALFINLLLEMANYLIETIVIYLIQSIVDNLILGVLEPYAWVTCCTVSDWSLLRL